MYYVRNAHPLTSQERDYVKGKENMDTNVFRDIEQPARRRLGCHRRAAGRGVELKNYISENKFICLESTLQLLELE